MPALRICGLFLTQLYLLNPSSFLLRRSLSTDGFVIHERRQLNLRLPKLTERRPRFPLPIRPSSAAISATTATTCSSLINSDLEMLCLLGYGNGDMVYKVRNRRTSQIYSLKLIRGDSDPLICHQILREMEILRRTDSPHIVNSHGIHETPSSNIKILMEYMDLGTLESLLKTKGRDFFMEERLAGIGRQVLVGLNYLHSHKIIHQDIKPESYTRALHGPFPIFATRV
ncbi:Mitogen-activated protein kinase kinase 9 [Linum perenne]